jgi:hypothetical protein
VTSVPCQSPAIEVCAWLSGERTNAANAMMASFEMIGILIILLLTAKRSTSEFYPLFHFLPVNRLPTPLRSGRYSVTVAP